MANSELYNKTFKIPVEIVNYIRSVLISNPNGDGIKRAKTLVNNGNLTYQSLKRLKNYFDYFNSNTGDKIQYNLAGGDLMRSFVERTLNQYRDATNRSKEIKSDVNDNPNSELKPYNLQKVNENDSSKSDKEVNVVAIIVDNDNKMLLLKRADFKDSWMPNKWSFVGGGVNKDETPENAIKREILEETGLKIDKFIKSLVIERIEQHNIEHLFACRYDGDPTDVNLNKENVKYGWYSISEIDYLDIVPHLMEYITLVFKSYDDE